MVFRARATLLFSVVLISGGIAGACGSDDSSTFDGGVDSGLDDGSLISNDGGIIGFGNDGSTTNPKGPLVIAPADKIIDVTFGTAIAPVSYTATVGGVSVSPAWSIDRGELGAIDVASGAFVASGKVGGKATITAAYGANIATTSITVNLHVVQNGASADDIAELDGGAGGDGGSGAGGFGGVGGSGVGGAYANPGIFPGSPTADASLQMLYPYDATVWPRGLLAPLLQWTNDKPWDGIYIHIQEAAFEYTGTFAPTSAAAFDTHPIPIDAWNQLSESNAGEDVTVTIELAAAGVVYGPMVEHWKIASAPLKGTVYYQSYGTNLATNFGGAKPDNHRFGAATLGIRPGQTAPFLVAGKTSADSSGCRVCHSVASDGSTLVTKWSDDKTSSSYDLHGTIGSNEYPIPASLNAAWPAVANNGAYVFTDSSNAVGSTTTPSGSYWVPSGDPMTTTGLPSGLRAAFPVFSPDGKHVAFTWYGGTVASFGTGDTNTLAIMDFSGPTGAEDAGGGGVTFSNFTPLYNPAGADAGAIGLRSIYPSFLPTSDAIVFENELRVDARTTGGQNYGETRGDCDNAAQACSATGSQSELWWIDLKTHTVHRLDKLNGDAYLPSSGVHNGAVDEILNYEPTVNPVPSGGYAWVVFTSRRLYGNVANRGAYESDPRNFDLTTTPTPKKLWVAAVDLNAPPGTDPSHPAFYLPAQELFAGNSRGYWVVDPCAADGSTCATGDECCGGFCRAGADGGLMCTDAKPTCAQEFEKCTTTADCCGKAAGITCIDNRCATPTPR